MTLLCPECGSTIIIKHGYLECNCGHILQEHIVSKIFLIMQRVEDLVVGFAIAEDGEGLVSHTTTHEVYVPHALGLRGRKCHDIYEEKYPDGYELVNYLEATDAELEADPVFVEAYNRNHADDQQAEAAKE